MVHRDSLSITDPGEILRGLLFVGEIGMKNNRGIVVVRVGGKKRCTPRVDLKVLVDPTGNVSLLRR